MCIFFNAKTDDHGGRRGDTEKILAQWWRPVASCKALDLLHRAMRTALHRRIAMVIEMASKGGAFLCIIVFCLTITVAKRPWCGQLKLKTNYVIVRYYV
jgi:hypothetical protein